MRKYFSASALIGSSFAELMLTVNNSAARYNIQLDVLLRRMESSRTLPSA